MKYAVISLLISMPLLNLMLYVLPRKELPWDVCIGAGFFAYMLSSAWVKYIREDK